MERAGLTLFPVRAVAGGPVRLRKTTKAGRMKTEFGRIFYGLAAVGFIYIFAAAIWNDRKEPPKKQKYPPILVLVARIFVIALSIMVLVMLFTGEL